MRQYQQLLADVIANGEPHQDRTGVGTLSVFGRQARFDLREGFPLLTTKKMFTKGIIVELLWMLRGDTSLHYLHEHNVHIWDEWEKLGGAKDLGPVYGKQWRSWTVSDELDIYVDQITQLLHDIKHSPNSRRLMVTAWNPGEIADMGLPPCHCLFQFRIYGDRLDCQLYQRSADIFLGVPFNIASYALLTMMIAKVCDLTPGYFIHTFGDLHLYNNHREQAELQLNRTPFALPTIEFPKKDLFSYEPSDFKLTGYQAWPALKGEVAV